MTPIWFEKSSKEKKVKERKRNPWTLGLVLVALGLVLVGCGSRLEGTTYEAKGSLFEVSLRFEGGKATVTTMGIATEFKYEVDGDKVKLITPQGTQVLTLVGDTLEGWPGVKLQKK